MLKTDIRKLYKAKRSALSEHDIDYLSRKITQNIIRNFDIANTICSIFLPIAHQKEVDTFLILELVNLEKITFVVSRSEFETGVLHHFIYESKNQLEINYLGIPEPKYGTIIPPSEIDFVFVPLLAIDNRGNRIGYGKGFYDRFLAQCSSKCQFIGLHLFDEFVKIDDLNPFDIPIHSCVTPNKIYHFEQTTSR